MGINYSGVYYLDGASVIQQIGSFPGIYDDIDVPIGRCNLIGDRLNLQGISDIMA